MQQHDYAFEVDATPQELWELFWGSRERVREHGPVRIEILCFGDEKGVGLVRHCHFPVPKYLLSGGRAKSWEWISESDPPWSWRYDAIGKPLWSCATGWTRFEPLDGGWTRVHFRETYHVFNPILRFLLERRVHRFISKDNDVQIRSAVLRGLEAMRARRARAGAPAAG